MMNNLYRTHATPTNRGAAMLLLLIFFMSASLMITLGIGRTAYYDIARYKTLKESKQVYYATESGLEDVLYRMRQGQTSSATESLTLAGVSITTTKTGFDPITIAAEGVKNNLYRSSRAVLQLGEGASFNFGLQSSTGGITLENSSTVTGNVYSNGSVTGSNNTITGDVVSAGPAGLISGIVTTGSAYAHTITNSTVGLDAYYYDDTTITSTLVSGSSCGGGGNIHCIETGTDPAIQPLPIDDTQIDDWKAKAEAGGTLPLASCSGGTAAGTYTINSDMTLGPIKIPCNLIIKKQGAGVTVTFQGPVWVEGNFETQSGPTLAVDPALNGESIQIIADKESDRNGSGKITIQQSTAFSATDESSYFVLVSMNDSSEAHETNTSIPVVSAISSENNTSDMEVIFYAPHGLISLSQSAAMRGATAHAIHLSNTANVQYETGMISLLFTGGAGGRFIVNSWEEIE